MQDLMTVWMNSRRRAEIVVIQRSDNYFIVIRFIYRPTIQMKYYLIPPLLPSSEVHTRIDSATAIVFQSNNNYYCAQCPYTVTAWDGDRNRTLCVIDRQLWPTGLLLKQIFSYVFTCRFYHSLCRLNQELHESHLRCDVDHNYSRRQEMRYSNI